MPPQPQTLFLEWGGDLILENRTSLQLATGWDLVRQRIERRIITNSAQQLPDGTFTTADYIFDQNYGIGAGKMIGQPFDEQFVATLYQRIQAGVLADAAVSTTIPPSIQLIQTNGGNTLWCVVGVTLANGNTGQIALSVSR